MGGQRSSCLLKVTLWKWGWELRSGVAIGLCCLCGEQPWGGGQAGGGTRHGGLTPGTGAEGAGSGGVTGLSLTLRLSRHPRPQDRGVTSPFQSCADGAQPPGGLQPSRVCAGSRGWAVQADSCLGFRFPAEPAPGPATSSVPCDPVVTRRGFLGRGAGLWSQRLSNHLPQGGSGVTSSIAKKKK